MKFREFKVLGERCSGTNHAKALIEKNLPLVERSACCWKHGIADPEAFHKNRDLLFVLVVRNLPDWLRSLHLTPHHLSPVMRGLSLGEFIRHEVRSVLDLSSGVSPLDPMFGSPLVGDEFPFSKECGPDGPFSNLIQLRSYKHHAWLDAVAKMPKSLVLRHEDLVSDSERCLCRVAELVAMPPPKFVEPVKFYKGQRAMGDFKPLQYAHFTQEEANFVLEQVDVALETRLGYDVISEVRGATHRAETPAEEMAFQASRHRHTERQLAEMRNYLNSVFAEYEKARIGSSRPSTKLGAWWRKIAG